jgi:hypothetical protein
MRGILLCFLVWALLGSVGFSAGRTLSGVLVHGRTGETLAGKSLAHSFYTGQDAGNWKPRHERETELWQELVTGDDGRFSIRTPDNGLYGIHLIDPVLTLPTGTIAELFAEGDANRELRLIACEGAVVEVSVVGADGKTPIDGDGDGLFLSPQAFEQEGYAATQRNLIYGRASGEGRILLGPMPPGEYLPYSAPDDGIRFAIPERRIQMELLDIPLQWGERRNVTLRVARLPILEKQVMLPSGEPAAGATVHVQGGEDWTFSTSADAAGLVRFEDVDDLLQGRVSIRKDGFATEVSGAEFRDATDPLVLSVSPEPVEAKPHLAEQEELKPTATGNPQGVAHRLRARVIDSEGFPLLGAAVSAVSLEGSGENTVQRDARSNAWGSFGIPIDEAGAVLITLSHSAYGQRSVVLPNVLTEQRFVLPRRAPLSVSVTMAGAAATGAYVALLPALAGIESPMPDTSLPGSFRFLKATQGEALLTAALDVEAGVQRRRQAWLSLESGKENTAEVAFPAGDAALTISAGAAGELDEFEKAVVHVELADGSQEMVKYSGEKAGLPITLAGLPAGSARVYILGEVKGYWNEAVDLRANETATFELGALQLAEVRGKLEGMREGLAYEAYLLQGKPDMARVGSVLRMHHGSPGELVLWADAISKQGGFELQAAPGQEVTVGIAEKRTPQNLAQADGGWRWVHVETVTPQAGETLDIQARVGYLENLTAGDS